MITCHTSIYIIVPLRCPSDTFIGMGKLNGPLIWINPTRPQYISIIPLNYTFLLCHVHTKYSELLLKHSSHYAFLEEEKTTTQNVLLLFIYHLDRVFYRFVIFALITVYITHDARQQIFFRLVERLQRQKPTLTRISTHTV